ncbi:DUF2637 domain-containing protein [Streptomyces sp. MBT33]|uniref:DUF2637 domain-containing protein n=1 Tax=Streptomyces sp. MBT33 TaxID=1488363 RepID=UPI001F29181F|nr:DUF2637 domain-containing protein [Streptomyces sp. MBT33]
MPKQWFSRARRDSKPKPPKQLNESGVPPLTRWERYGAILTALGGAAVGGLGFYASFDAVSAAAETWGFVKPWVLPVAIDSAIPVFTAANLYLIRMGMALAWVRFVPWALSLITCALNVAAGHSLWAKVAHGAISLLWAGVSEVAAHIYAVRIGAATGRRRQMEKVRRARWMLSPLPTFLLWRRMQLWEERSYDTALRLEQERIVYQSQLRGRFGRAWRRKAPVASLLPLQLVDAGVPLAETAPAGLRAAGIEPADIGAAIPAPVASTTPASTVAAVPAPGGSPTPPVLPAVKRPRSIRAAAPAQSQASIPQWSTEGELYEIIKDAIDNGRREVFNGPLTGKAIGLVLGKHEGEGRKIRLRLIKTYAATKGISIPDRAGIDEALVLFGQALTPVNP